MASATSDSAAIATQRASTSGRNPAREDMRATKTRNHPTTSPVRIATSTVRCKLARVCAPSAASVRVSGGIEITASATPVQASAVGRSPSSTPTRTGTLIPTTQKIGDATLTGPRASE